MKRLENHCPIQDHFIWELTSVLKICHSIFHQLSVQYKCRQHFVHLCCFEEPFLASLDLLRQVSMATGVLDPILYPTVLTTDMMENGDPYPFFPVKSTICITLHAMLSVCSQLYLCQIDCIFNGLISLHKKVLGTYFHCGPEFMQQLQLHIDCIVEHLIYS